MFKRKGCFLSFLMGAFSLAQINIGGNIGISELGCCICAPFIFLRDLNHYRKDESSVFFLLAIIQIFGCCVSGWVNGTDFPLFIRGFAATYSIFACVVCFYHVLRKDVGLYKYVFFGFAVSGVINTFGFHYGAEINAAMNATGEASTDAIMQGTLFWVTRLESWLKLPTKIAYLQTPTWLGAILSAGLAVYSIAGTASGRSAALSALGGVFLMIMAGRSPRKMLLISKRLGLVALIAILSVFAMKTGYSALAKANLLNEAQMKKYNSQTKGGKDTSTLRILMSGRVEFFTGLYAAIKRPIVGYGPWPRDEQGLFREFMSKYGDAEDYEKLEKEIAYRQRMGFPTSWLPAHSQIIEFWHWFSIAGLVFQLYVFYLYMEYFRKYLATVPQLFGCLAVQIPGLLWHYFFSPFGGRPTYCALWAILLLNRAVAIGSVRLPFDMWKEKLKAERGVYK